MAGDWIKMRTDLGTSPKVVRLASALKADRLRIIGGLHSAWCLFDSHSVDGELLGYTTDIMDDLIGWPGFAKAMVDVGWLEISPECVAIPRFDAHNGQSAKRRAMDADRKRVRRMSASEADARPQNVRPREEKRREEKEPKATVHSAAPTAPDEGPVDDLGMPGDIAVPAAPEREVPARISGEKKQQTAVRFPEFWAAYPVKKGRADALKKWKSKGLDALADTIISHVRRMEREDDDWLRGFIPHGSTYINGERWEDEPKKDKPATAPAPAPETFGAKAAMVRSETKLENAIAHIRQRFDRGEFGDGEPGQAEMRRLISEATDKHREEACRS